MASPAYAAAADAATEYLAARVLDDKWAAEHDDVAYYFKAPMAFIEAGALEDAERALARAAKYADRGGEGSANGAYSGIFQHYPLMWICWAATRLDQKNLAEKCYSNLWKYVEPSKCAGVVERPWSAEAEAAAACEADLFATAEVLKVALLVGRGDVAHRAASTLREVLAANTESKASGVFYLRWRAESDAAVAPQLVRKDDMFHCIAQSTPGQLYFLLAFPAMALLEYAASGAAQSDAEGAASRAAALDMLEFLKGCGGVYESPMAHKYGRAAAMAGDAEAATRIADYLVSLQQESGGFQADPEAMDCVDQSAEIAVWLRQIARDLSTR